MQDPPSPMYDWLHEHMNDPTVLVHEAGNCEHRWHIHHYLLQATYMSRFYSFFLVWIVVGLDGNGRKTRAFVCKSRIFVCNFGLSASL